MMHDYFHIELSTSYSSRHCHNEKTRSTVNVKQFAVTPTLPKKTQLQRNTSFITGQKLRESKWFTHEEVRIFSAVVETGFIVQVKNEKAQITWGIAHWTAGYEKSKNVEQLTVYFLTKHKDDYKVTSQKLLEFWQPGSVIKINNYSDKDETANSEDVIKNKILYAKKNKLKWHNPEHFVYWCRYLQPKGKLRQASDEMKWFNSKVNLGLILLRGRKKSLV